MRTNSLDRFKKRRKLKNTITTYGDVDKKLVNELLDSEVNQEKIDNIYESLSEHYDISVSEEEVTDFLEKFKKDFNDQKFKRLVTDCQKEVINNIVIPFGLGKIVAAYDKTGGNVTTQNNFEQGITATKDDQQRHDEWKKSINNNVDREQHDTVKDEWGKDTYQSMQDGEKVTDGYTGKTLGHKNGTRIDKYVSIHGEHITSVSEIEKDSKNHLFAVGNNADERSKDRANTSGNKDNLTLIEGGMNSSKNDSDLKEWANSKISKKHVKETENPYMTNAEYYELNPELIEREYRKSKEFIQKEQLKKQVIKQGKEFVSTGVSEGAKMGIQQAIGLVLVEFFTALFDEIIDIYKNGFDNGFKEDKFLSILASRLRRIGERIASKWKDVAIAFKDGAISGFISNMITTLTNAFVTTAKRTVRIIREGIFSLYRAVKLLLFPPEGMTFSDAMHEAKKLIASGIIISIGVVIEQYVDAMIKTMAFLEPFADIVTSILIGSITGLTVILVAYYIDKKKNDRDLFNNLVCDTNKKFEEFNKILSFDDMIPRVSNGL